MIPGQTLGDGVCCTQLMVGRVREAGREESCQMCLLVVLSLPRGAAQPLELGWGCI